MLSHENIIRLLIREMARQPQRQPQERPKPTLEAPFKTLVVGGDESFVERKIKDQLAKHGLEVVANWPWDKSRGAAPKDIQVIFILTDMTGHRDNDAAQKLAAARGIPLIYGVRKFSHNTSSLASQGYPDLTKAIVIEGAGIDDLTLLVWLPT
jgi:hypothetical protein